MERNGKEKITVVLRRDQNIVPGVSSVGRVLKELKEKKVGQRDGTMIDTV
ncbi:MAG: hypothetical protein LBB13_00175 [Rickettsiales bacterium]|nr:hypothetical protein [Rickettsiales bacterium]